MVISLNLNRGRSTDSISAGSYRLYLHGSLSCQWCLRPLDQQYADLGEICSVIAFRFIPNSVVSRPVSAVWQPLVHKPFFAMSYKARLAIGWACLAAIVFGSAFGFPLTGVSLPPLDTHTVSNAI